MVRARPAGIASPCLPPCTPGRAGPFRKLKIAPRRDVVASFLAPRRRSATVVPCRHPTAVQPALTRPTVPAGAFPFLRRRRSARMRRISTGVGNWERRRFAMEGKTRTRRERWMQRAAAAYRRMFEGKSEAELVTLTQREDMAVMIGKELAAFLREEHVARDPAAQPEEASSTCCPKCGQAGTPAVQKGEELPERTLTTRAGDIRLRRQRWRCAKCRIVFFRWTFDWGWGRKAIARSCWRRRFVKLARRPLSPRQAETCGNWRRWRSARHTCNG